MSELTAVQDDIIETFALLGDWAERYQYIIDLGRQAPAFPEAWKIERYRLKGCQSQVWIVTELNEDKLQIHATSDSAIVAGLIALLVMVYSNRRPAEIIATPPDLSARFSSTITYRRPAVMVSQQWCSRSGRWRWKHWRGSIRPVIEEIPNPLNAPKSVRTQHVCVRKAR